MTITRLTTRRVDGFTDLELGLLEVAASHSVIWIAAGASGISATLDAAHVLQRLGYIWPTTQHKPDDQRAYGWRIEPEGREALAVALERKAA